VELVFPSGLSLGIPLHEITKTCAKTPSQFADFLEVGASFPMVSFLIRVMKDPKPLWLTSDHNSPQPHPKPAPSAADADTDDEPFNVLPTTRPALPHGPMPPAPMPTYFPYSGGSGGRSH
jgi:hypothetical protein